MTLCHGTVEKSLIIGLGQVKYRMNLLFCKIEVLKNDGNWSKGHRWQLEVSPHG